MIFYQLSSVRIRGSRKGGRGGCSWQRQRRREGEGRSEEGAQPIAHPGSGDGLRAPQASFSPCLTLHHSDTVWGREDVHSSNGHRPAAPGLHSSREWSPSPGTMETTSESSFMMTVEGHQPIETAAAQQGPHFLALAPHVPQQSSAATTSEHTCG